MHCKWDIIYILASSKGFEMIKQINEGIGLISVQKTALLYENQ